MNPEPLHQLEQQALVASLAAATDWIGSHAAMARASGVHPRTVSRVVRGAHAPLWSTVTRMWRSFDQFLAPHSAPRLDDVVAALVADIDNGLLPATSPDRIRSAARTLLARHYIDPTQMVEVEPAGEATATEVEGGREPHAPA